MATAFEKHLLFFVDDNGDLTYHSLVESMKKLKLDTYTRCKIIALAVLMRFRHLSDYIDPHSWVPGPLNWKIPVHRVIEGKHPASLNVWNSQGDVDDTQFDILVGHLNHQGVLTPDALGYMVDACAARDSKQLNNG